MTDERYEHYGQLARYLSASVIADRLGISLAYAYTRYCKDGPVGQNWLELAEILAKGAAETMERVLRPAFAKPLTNLKQ